MTKDDDALLLDVYLAAARRETPRAPPELVSAGLASAAAVTAERVPTRRATPARRLGWQLRPALRGWAPATGALAASALLGLWIGIASDQGPSSILANAWSPEAGDPVAGFFDLAAAEN